MKKTKFETCEKHYDEMQILSRGRGFMFAYLTAIIVLAVLTFLEDINDYITPYAELIITTWTSVTVFSIYTITHNAYDRINDTKSGKVLFCAFGIAGAFILAVTFLRVEHFKEVKENSLAHISGGVLMIINCAFYFIYHLIHKDKADDEE
ncbi:MAG: hypothetical protein ACI4I6_05300 [Hominimerdicola sp.]